MKMMMNKYYKKLKKAMAPFMKDPFFLGYWDEPHYYRTRHNDDQLSVRISAQNKRKSYHFYGTPSMFVEDMYSGIVPFMHQRGEREKYPIKLSPTVSKEKERMIAFSVSGRGHPTFLEDAVYSFIGTATQTLFQDGVVFYEIIYKKDTAGAIESFSFEYVQPFYFFKIFSNYYQFILWGEAKSSHTRVRIIKIPEEKIMVINLPKSLGGRSIINKILKRLWKLGKEIVPTFQMEAMDENINIAFDFKDFNKQKYIEVARLTKGFGWNQRQISGDNNITEYYSMYRFLKQKKVEALIRDEVVSKINHTLNGSYLNLGVNITTENIFSFTDIEKLEKKLKGGDVAFMDLFKSTNF